MHLDALSPTKGKLNIFIEPGRRYPYTKIKKL